MKSIQFILLNILLWASVIAHSQNDSVYVAKLTDDMEGKSFYTPSRKMVCAKQDRKTGFSVSAFLDYNNGDVAVDELKIRMVNIGGCSENTEIIILFTDSTKITLTSWNEFNCKGDAWFKLSKPDKEKLSTVKKKKIKVQNGRTYESYTHTLVEDNDYFIQLFYAVKNKKIKEEKE